jgi:arylsulfatase A-like enzyme
MRIPMLWSGPGIAPSPDAHPAHVSLVDVLPTLCEAVGAPIPAGVQGRSLWPLLTGAPYPREEFASVYAEQGFGGLHYTDADEGRPDLADPLQDGVQPGRFYDCLNSRTQSGSLRMLRKGEWKLALDMMGRGQLYHLPSDPVERVNRFGDPECAAVQAELLQELLAWCIRAEDPLPYPRARYVAKRDPRNWYSPYR